MTNSSFSKSFLSSSNRPQPSEVATPFSIRLTPSERAFLERKAKRTPLGTYIRAQLLGENSQSRKATVKPTINDAALARILAVLGSSGLSANIARLADAAGDGSINATPELKRDLRLACDAIQDIRRETIKALGVRSK